jgi:hypothetical protein
MAGEIKYKQRFMQNKDFHSLQYGTITPTDIDAFIDFGNIVFVVIELKLKGTDVPYGQKLALEMLVDNFKKPIIGIIAEHDTNSNETIDVADCIVKEYRWKYSWKTKKSMTVKKLIDIILKFYKLEYTKPESLEITEEDYKKIDEYAKGNLNNG